MKVTAFIRKTAAKNNVTDQARVYFRVRDVLAGHILSGISRGTEALISACAIGFGIAVVLRFF